ncbi:MAG: hypothetical protein K8R21_09530 [Leptospira sp.]|nr:hypothetical protein [Leptospira sp.]
MESKYRDKAKQFLSNQDKISASASGIIDFIFESSVGKILPEKLESRISYFSALDKNDTMFSELLKSFKFEEIFPANSVSKCISTETLEAIAEISSTPGYKPSKQLLVKLLNQEAIRDLLANIIESAIVEFNKKINPFFGAIQATGIDKQIKTFLYPFLPALLEKIADFVFNSPAGEEGRKMIKNTAKILLTAEFSEVIGPTSAELSELQGNFEKLKTSVSNDRILEDSAALFYTNFRNFLLSGSKDLKLKEVFGLSEAEYTKFKTELSAIIAKDIIEYNKKNPMDEVLGRVISGILD